MKRCDPVQTRKNLEMANDMAKGGIDFFPMPVLSEEHRKELASQSHDILEILMGLVQDKSHKDSEL